MPKKSEEEENDRQYSQLSKDEDIQTEIRAEEMPQFETELSDIKTTEEV